MRYAGFDKFKVWNAVKHGHLRNLSHRDEWGRKRFNVPGLFVAGAETHPVGVAPTDVLAAVPTANYSVGLNWKSAGLSAQRESSK